LQYYAAFASLYWKERIEFYIGFYSHLATKQSDNSGTAKLACPQVQKFLPSAFFPLLKILLMIVF
jgi:hypothetical protein